MFVYIGFERIFNVFLYICGVKNQQTIKIIMKNIFRLFAVVAMVAALATSCSKTEEDPVTPPTPPTPSGDITPGTLEIRFRCGGDLFNIENMNVALSYKDGESTQTKNFTEADFVEQASSYTDPLLGIVYTFDHELLVKVAMATLPQTVNYGIVFTTKEGVDTTKKYSIYRALSFTYKDKSGETISTTTVDMGRALDVAGDKLGDFMKLMSGIYADTAYTIQENGVLK